ncbi:hypothetical protein [Deinococcus soli (ex Cha et al. 2016)]|uniref:Uncharacterized protein n=2 Tax=Deinococcus soli (ex Cha et al. 2016) TaxID=1309411 RepID=A0AAE3XES2_9DEIO|nr:hypothetical protein [Deinococcus soli (ex Cha et al. 2016)]MDR6218785.1 hypothetical protein [Deinococcus soli (ex Cha et al. 2016)]MDR6328582.1 hypothetical protein [Deinococcus soli (ex Cha et al. 2016)]MDR6751931.1 hypothetical protein [Deinococcus soli (ex Cha et al. 2016)]
MTGHTRRAHAFATELLSGLTDDLFSEDGAAKAQFTATFDHTLSTLHDLLAATELLSPEADHAPEVLAAAQRAERQYAQTSGRPTERAAVRVTAAADLLRDLRPWIQPPAPLPAAFIHDLRGVLTEESGVTPSDAQLTALVRSDLRLTRDGTQGAPDSETRARVLDVLSLNLVGEKWPDHAWTSAPAQAFRGRLRHAAQQAGYPVQ